LHRAVRDVPARAFRRLSEDGAGQDECGDETKPSDPQGEHVIHPQEATPLDSGADVVKLDPRPTATNVLESGEEGSVHVDHALEYNEDPSYLAELMLHKLTVEARQRVDRAGLSRRELARRLGTSVPQLYRLLDPANTRKSLGQLIGLLHLLECDACCVARPEGHAGPPHAA